MDLDGKRFLVAGATGSLGGMLARELIPAIVNAVQDDRRSLAWDLQERSLVAG